ncbi:hypothetical protein CROQUDRAFT_101560 [Cronartium quercuum f. sp. fusiforme G11]|uniref:Uncharacterized protein n=1 Tax=Cronartium quercuum f. sp. fusiforme G11 TaxID=708437 RepID=A0A9P6T6H4_9BASI|nr:hypothetical protein CROQUDRAFT_101560 [Cronartium quercuum f. sp. fusiforme G11]
MLVSCKPFDDPSQPKSKLGPVQILRKKDPTRLTRTPRGQLDRPKTVDCRPSPKGHKDGPYEDARSIGARFCLLTAIQACIEASSGGPAKPKRLLASDRF